jgi:murein DD-endopeptidase MepM/ murein hydrolase activator NlpD
MLKHAHILPKFTRKGVLDYAKTALASNLALGLIVIPTASNPISEPQNSLMIPEQTLASSFNIPNSTPDTKTIQIPLVYTYISQGFSSYHPAIDMAAKYGTAVFPVKAGTVTQAGFSPFGYGNMIIVDHGDGFESLYAHLSKIEVKKGQTVNLDTELGKVGITGHSTGPHLHLEIHQNGTPINPFSFLPPLSKGPTLLSSLQQ